MKPSCRFAAAALLSIPLWAGCDGCSRRETSTGPATGSDSDATWDEDLFGFAVVSLGRADEFGPEAMFGQVVGRLGQWMRTQKASAEWKPDAMVGTLPDAQAKSWPMASLGALEFTVPDGDALREAIWLRDLSAWVAGKSANDLDRVGRLFDWTVRNIMVSGGDSLVQMPWETLLFGRGTAIDRAWVFALLCQHQGFDAAVLTATGPGESKEPWAVGVRIDKDVYLFDPVLGLPIAAPGGIRRKPNGALDLKPATLEQAAADKSVLSSFRARPEEAARTAALIVASPTSLSRRMKIIESRLPGRDKVTLTTAASAQAERWKGCARIAEAKLWPAPFEAFAKRYQPTEAQAEPRKAAMRAFTLADFELWKGRVRHLKGRFFDEEESAVGAYQKMRQARVDIAVIDRQLMDYYVKTIHQTNPSWSKEQLEAAARERVNADMGFIVRASMDATYWLGLISMENGEWTEAIGYFDRRLVASFPKTPWRPGARYNLGRCYEAQGEIAKAIAELKASGNPLRAEWLERK